MKFCFAKTKLTLLNINISMSCNPKISVILYSYNNDIKLTQALLLIFLPK